MGQCLGFVSTSAVDNVEEGSRAPKELDDRDTSFSGTSIKGNLVREQHVDFRKLYTVVDLIGEGSISNISKIKRKESARVAMSGKQETRQEAEYYALKEIDLSFVDPDLIAELRNEIEKLKSLDHPNIIKIYETFKIKKRLAIVMELMEGGDLYTRYPYTEAQAARVVRQILSAVAYLHDRSIIHRYIKFENIMFESEDPNARVKLIDFGLAKVYLDRPLTDRVGTLYTMAPSVIRGNYISKADLWSVGVVAYMLMSGEKPFWSRTKSELISQILTARYSFHGQHWKNISKEGKSFVRALLVLDPEVRLSARQALKHRWLDVNTQWSQEKPDLDALRNAKANLARYAESPEFKKLALMVIAKKSTPKEIFELRKVFDEIDTENTGTVTYKGFRKALEELYSESQIKDMFDKIDLDRSGFIEYTEFLAATLEAQGRIEEYRIAEAFEQLGDSQGYITKQNLCKILGREYSDPASNDYIDKLISEIDEDGDGRVSYDDFKYALSKAVDTKIKQLIEKCESFAA